MFKENSLCLILPDYCPDTLDRNMTCSYFYLHASLLLFSVGVSCEELAAEQVRNHFIS